MNNGVLIFAHNNPSVDYGLMAIIAGGLAKKNLNVPVSLVTDKYTLEWMTESGNKDKALEIFDKIIEVEKPVTKNYRKLHDGFDSQNIPFENSNRYSAWDLSPYDKTLLIDSDFLIFSNSLNEYWNVDSPVIMGQTINDITGERIGVLDRRVSETGIHMFWATTVMFDKSQESKFFFHLVNFVRDNYRYYADLYRFDPRQFRNDIAFSVARHIMNGYEVDQIYSLPPVLSVYDKDILLSVDGNKLVHLIDKPNDCGSFWAAATEGIDIHVMNKQSIIRNKERLMEII